MTTTKEQDAALWELIVGIVETWETWEIRRLAELLEGYADLRDDGLVPKLEL